MLACIGRNLSPLFKLIKYKIVVFEEVYVLSHFNIDFIVSPLYKLTENVRETKHIFSPQNYSKYLHYD
jgi:hypothetical protein